MRPLLNASKEWQTVPAGSFKSRTSMKHLENKLSLVTNWRAKKTKKVK